LLIGVISFLILCGAALFLYKHYHKTSEHALSQHKEGEILQDDTDERERRQGAFFDSNEGRRKDACKGYYSLTLKKKTASGEQWMLKDNDKRTITIDLREPAAMSLYNCLDIDNDGQKEAVVEYFTLGIHCCFEYHFYRKTKTGLKLFESIDLGSASWPVFNDINKDGKPEILTFDDSFSYFGGLCFACSPELPLILCYRNQKFSDCTNQFPAILDRSIEETLKEKLNNPFYKRGLALQYLVLQIMRGKSQAGWQGAREYYPESYSWLRESEREINKIIEGRYGINR